MRPLGILAYLQLLSFVVWFATGLLWLGQGIGQMNANAVRAQAEIQREAQAEFIKAIQAAGMEVHMEEGPSLEPRKG